MTAQQKTEMLHRAPAWEWLASLKEEVMEPDLPIVDAHTHLFDRPYWRYLLHEMVADMGEGHKVVGTVHVQNHQYYRADGEPTMAPVGETEFCNGYAAMTASGHYGPVRVCAGIVGYADLRLGKAVEPILMAHRRAGGDRFKGIRNVVCSHPNPGVRASSFAYPPGMLADDGFRQGVEILVSMGLSLDTYVYFTQHDELATFLDRFPRANVILNHVGGVVGVGPYAGKRDEVFAQWSVTIRELAKRPNLRVKLGGLGMPVLGFGFENLASPATSSQIADAWRPYFDTCIELFGTQRCMFESNFPIDNVSLSYRTLWNAYKKIAAGCSDGEKRDLFSQTAVETYRLQAELGSFLAAGSTHARD